MFALDDRAHAQARARALVVGDGALAKRDSPRCACCRSSLWQGGFGGPVNANDVRQVLLLGVFCTALAHTLYTASLARLPASTVAVCAALEPVYGIALALWLLREVPDGRTIAGATLLVVAAIVASRRTRVAPPA